MTVMDIVQYVYGQICEIKSVSLVSPESKLRELGINSIEFIQIIVNVETEFDFTIPDELLFFDDVTTVGDFTDSIKNAYEARV